MLGSAAGGQSQKNIWAKIHSLFCKLDDFLNKNLLHGSKKI
jgi:hypothetical protein